MASSKLWILCLTRRAQNGSLFQEVLLTGGITENGVFGAAHQKFIRADLCCSEKLSDSHHVILHEAWIGPAWTYAQAAAIRQRTSTVLVAISSFSSVSQRKGRPKIPRDSYVAAIIISGAYAHFTKANYHAP